MNQMSSPSAETAEPQPWASTIYKALKDFDVRQVAYVPDGGHAELIRRVQADSKMRAVTLTTEEEGVALLTGAWLGGQRGVLLMQSSGVGNCVNMFSLAKLGGIPLLMLVTMRGEWGEFNPWQVPMGSATQGALELMDIQVLRASRLDDVDETVRAAAAMAFDGGVAMAVLLSQRLIGAKNFAK